MDADQFKQAVDRFTVLLRAAEDETGVRVKPNYSWAGNDLDVEDAETVRAATLTQSWDGNEHRYTVEDYDPYDAEESMESYRHHIESGQ